jgi:hypothetical protein
VRLELAPSRILAALIVGVHVAGGACIALAVPGAAGWLLGALLVCLGAAAAWDRALLRGRGSARAIEIGAEGCAEVVTALGERWQARSAGCRVSRFWVAIPLRGFFRGPLFVLAGMIEPRGFRALRLWALWGRVPGVAPAQPRN